MSLPNKQVCKKNTPIFPSADIVVVDHNVVGKNGVLNEVCLKTQRAVSSHYGPRGVDHLPPRAKQISYILTNKPKNLQKHLDYRAQLRKNKTPIYAVSSLKKIPVNPSNTVLYLPYINRKTPKFPKTGTWISYGLPETMSKIVNRKTSLHKLLAANSHFANHVPSFAIMPTSSLVKNGQKIARLIKNMYRLAKVDNNTGLIIRPQTDGMYGSIKLEQFNAPITIKDKFQGLQHIEAGKIVLFPNGQTKNILCFNNWKTALKAAQKHIDANMQNKTLLVTRLLDLSVSPGMAVFITNGKTTYLPWNGQWQEPGESACTGTTNYSLIGETKIQKIFYKKTLKISQDLIGSLLAKEKKSKTYAVLNIDFMILGAKEINLWEKTKTNPKLRQFTSRKNRNYQSYQPLAYNPKFPLISEINGRDTNWTLSLKSVAQILFDELSLQNLLKLVNDKKIKILSQDAWSLPKGIDIPKARKLLLEFHQQVYSKKQGGFILRMPDQPAGITVFALNGHNPIEIRDRAYKKLQKALK